MFIKHVVVVTLSGMSVLFRFEGTVSVYTCCPAMLSVSSPFTLKKCHSNMVSMFFSLYSALFMRFCERLLILFMVISHISASSEQLGCFYYLHMVTHNYSNSPFKVDLRKFGVRFATCRITNSMVCIFILISFFCFSFLFLSCSFFSSPISNLYLEFYASLAAILNYFWDVAVNKEAQNKQIASRTYLICFNDWKQLFFLPWMLNVFHFLSISLIQDVLNRWADSVVVWYTVKRWSYYTSKLISDQSAT